MEVLDPRRGIALLTGKDFERRRRRIGRAAAVGTSALLGGICMGNQN